MFSGKDKLHDVCSYFVRIHKSMQKNEKMQLLNSLPLSDLESTLAKIVEITPETAIKNPTIVNALSQYAKNTKHNIFAMKIPDNMESRKEFILCKENLNKYREYLYLEHDIFVTSSVDLLNALYAIYIFKLNRSTNSNQVRENETTEKATLPLIQVRKCHALHWSNYNF